MSQGLSLRLLLAAGASAAAFVSQASAQEAPANPGTVIEEVVVTAQKREESLQSVPIAVSAFSQATLERQKIDGGSNLQLAIPNVTFSKSNTIGYNFQIRGIGSKLNTASGDTATGIHLNNAPLTANSLFEAEFYDVERVEVLRGPQGTLYGRNATGGVVNIITAKPTHDFSAMLRGEVGDYNARKARGMINLPLGETFALRLAGSYLKRDGFGTNLTTGSDVDNRDLYSVRGTLAFDPNDKFGATLMWEHFKENDRRSRIGKMYCTKDEGPTSVGGVAVSGNAALANVERGLLSQGCSATSIYSASALGTPNYLASLEGITALAAGLISSDPYAGKMQTPGLRDIESRFDPKYRAKNDVAELNLHYALSDSLTLTSLTSYSTYDVYSSEDYTRAQPTGTFNSTAISPGGVFTDPQIGAYNRLATYDISRGNFKQWTQELRLQSNFDGPFNFNVGGIYVDYKTDTSYQVVSNGITALAVARNGGVPCAATSTTCIYIDPNQEPDGSGHNYFLSRQPYHLKASAAFGEAYYKATDSLKFTLGLRWTHDDKTVDNIPSETLIAGSGYPVGTPAQQKADYKAVTGRFGADWKPVVPFTQDTLVYAFYSKGYKGGGVNPPSAVGFAGTKASFDPEFVNAYEIGTKNTLLGGSLQLNATAFYYDYKNYQVAKVANRQTVVENVDAEVKGAELEFVWKPTTPLRINGTLGLLDTKIKTGSSIDTFNRTAGNTAYAVVKASNGQTCIAPTALIAGYLTAINSGTLPVTALLTICNNAAASEGFVTQLKGKELPNAPSMTLSLGAQYDWVLPNDWSVSLRGDYYRQTHTYARVYNTEADRLKGWENVNLSLVVANKPKGLTIEAYVKNATDETAVTDLYLSDSALFRNGFFTDPRTYGISLTKQF
ncbi:TonB-dependent receptor [Caulobacter hibisci]|uniref:TonB-dependent receptor n=1 Tax=Caulobacter hibisci TaxID=2035993 RepID=A0ABS0SWU7_9CAUL|nr:TonB-dependent receptor [Caulobacter hibisci]MBI1684107.1 TonB-dependent receptor [Caulobacter hibisci]